LVSIKITEIKKNNFLVEVNDKVKTSHNVVIHDKVYQQLTNGEISKYELLEKSFAFLLDREPNTSILTNFEIQIISHYFSDYANCVRTWCKIE
jgi:hypothetical protein